MKIVKLLGTLSAVIAIIFFLYMAISEASVFNKIAFDLKNGYILLVTVLLYVLAMSSGGAVWGVLLRGVKEYLPASIALCIVFLSQAAKYVPGNVTHHIGRVVLAKRYGLGMTNTLFTIFMETVWVIVIAGLLALVAIASIGGRIFAEVPHLPQWWVLGGVVVFSMVAPVLGHRLFEHGALWWASRKGITIQTVQMPPLRTFWLVGLLYIINFLILGLILQLIAAQVFGASDGSFLLFSGIFAVAWIVGFITPGAPAGLGVREVVLVAALTPICGNENAIGIAAVLRVVTVLGDGLVFLIGLGLAKYTKNNRLESHEVPD